MEQLRELARMMDSGTGVNQVVKVRSCSSITSVNAMFMPDTSLKYVSV